MNCPFCNAEITAEDKLCPICGAPVNEETAEQPAVEETTEAPVAEAPVQAPGKAGMIMGIVAAALVLVGCCCVYLGLITIPVAAILSIIALIKNVGELKKAKQAGVKNTFALVGTILSAAALAIAVVLIVLVVVLMLVYGAAIFAAILSGDFSF